MTDTVAFAVSIESELDKEIDRLIGKVVNGTASPEEREQLRVLSSRRIRMMQGRSASRYDEREGRIRGMA